MKIETNEKLLVNVSVMGAVCQPNFQGLPAEPYRLDSDGNPFLLPSWGSIVHNVSVGDSAFGWEADCIHPSVSIKYSNEAGNRGLNILSCVGNEAVIMNGNVKNSIGFVSGKSGRFSEQVIVHFPKKIREKISINDKILIKSIGVGLKIKNFESVFCKSLAPKILNQMRIKILNKKMIIPVTHIIPEHLVGAGSGLTSESGSLHIQTTDEKEMQKFKLNNIRLGDFVFIENYDSSYQHGFLRNAWAVGIIGQTNGPRAGYGPGITVLMSSKTNNAKPNITTKANIINYLNFKK
jgi:hypothetical protein